MAILVTGAAGFIGSFVAARLLDRGEAVVGVDSFNSYYDPALKRARAAQLQGRPGFRMVEGDVADAGATAALVREAGAVRVVHLAAQAGVRHSLDDPFAYERANVAGHLSGAGGLPPRTRTSRTWSTPPPPPSTATARPRARRSGRTTRRPTPCRSTPPPSARAS